MPVPPLQSLVRKSFAESACIAVAGVLFATIGTLAVLELFVMPGSLFRLAVGKPLAPYDAPKSDPASLTRANNSGDPYLSIMDHFKSEKEKKSDEESRQKEAAQQLRSNVEQGRDQVRGKLSQLETARRELADEVQQVTGTSVDAKALPDELARLIADRRTVAEAWTAIRNVLTDDAAEHSAKDSIQTANDHIQAGTIGEDDVQRMASADTELDSALKAIADSKRSLEHIQVMLQAQRFERHETEPQVKS